MSVFRMTPEEKDFEEIILTTPAPGKHCARNAFRHIERAWRIAEIDPEMAAFRAITAEEEAASAVFHAIRRWKYPAWQKLKPHDHIQKNALYPFCTAIRSFLAVADQELHLEPRLFVNMEEKRLSLKFLNPEKFGRGPWPTGTTAACTPPLHFSFNEGDVLYDFSKQLANNAAARNIDSIKSYLEKRAQRRNDILYARANGIPNVQLDHFLEGQREVVFLLLGVYLLIDPYPEKQNFVQQAVLAFLKALSQLPKDMNFQ